jgi:DNA adenine methylase
MKPAHLHYVEPYFGGGALLLASDPEGVSEVVNDLDGELINFWRTLQTPALFDTLRRCLQATPFSEDAWRRGTPGGKCSARWRTALATRPTSFILCRQSLAGRMKSFAPLSRTRTRRGMNEQASAWMNAVDGLAEVHGRLRRVVILNRPALDVIREQDGPDTLFYLDPPYLHETRVTTGDYTHEMTAEQHTDLCTVIRQCKGKVMLSGYPSELYRFQLEECGWHRRDFDLPEQRGRRRGEAAHDRKRLDELPAGDKNEWLTRPRRPATQRSTSSFASWRPSTSGRPSRRRNGSRPRTCRPARPATGPATTYNRRGDWLAFLRGYGWKVDHQRGDTVYLTRPGKGRACRPRSIGARRRTGARGCTSGLPTRPRSSRTPATTCTGLTRS